MRNTPYVKTTLAALVVATASFAAVAGLDEASGVAITLIPGVMVLENNVVPNPLGGCTGDYKVSYLPLFIQEWEIDSVINADCSVTSTFYEIVTLDEANGGGVKTVRATVWNHVWVSATGDYNGQSVRLVGSNHGQDNGGQHHSSLCGSSWGEQGGWAYHSDCFSATSGSGSHTAWAGVKYDGAGACQVNGNAQCTSSSSGGGSSGGGGSGGGGGGGCGGATSCRNARTSTTASSGQTGYATVE